MFGIFAASMALFGQTPSDLENNNLDKLFNSVRPFLFLLAVTGPYSMLRHYFLGSRGRRMSDTFRVCCYSTGTFFIVGAAFAPFIDATRQWPLYVLAPVAIFLIIIRPYQIIHRSHGVGIGRYFFASALANFIAVVPALLIIAALAFMLETLGLLPAQ